MEIVFGSHKLQKTCNSERESGRKWGAQNARKVRQRLTELAAAATLADVSRVPPVRLHQLRGNMAGKFAVDVKHPFRVVFEPANDPIPKKDDRGIDLVRITRIRVLSVEDYHGD